MLARRSPEPATAAAPSIDLKALADAANEAAKREATQWFFFITIMITLAAIVGSTTHRVLLLEGAVKVPILSIELPLLGFYVAAPAIFLVLHFYLLAQVRLMADKVTAFLDEAERETKGGRGALRREIRRLDPFSVAQFLAAKRLGDRAVALRLMVWTTLAIAPVLLLLFVQIRFLPYHEPWITWWHRAVLTADLIVLWWLWPRMKSHGRLTQVASWAIAALSTMTALFFAYVLATIPEETAEHIVDRVAGHIGPSFPAFAPQVEAWPLEIFWWRLRGLHEASHNATNSPRNTETSRQINIPEEAWLAAMRRALFDGDVDPDTQRPRSLFSRSLVLPDEVLIGPDDLKTFREDPEKARDNIARTVVLRGRDLRRAVLDRADLRRADLTGARLEGASFIAAKLTGTYFERAQLQGAWLIKAQLQGASLKGAQLQGAWLIETQLRGASLDGAKLQGAGLLGVQLQGASLIETQLRGASFDGTTLQGASLDRAQLQGASLDGARLQGASLKGAWLQGASLFAAQLQGASLDGAWLQGAWLDGAKLQGASLTTASLQGAWLDGAELQGVTLNGALFGARLQGALLRDIGAWRLQASQAKLAEALIASPRYDDKPPCIQPRVGCEPAKSWAEVVERWLAEVPDGPRRSAAYKGLAVLLAPNDPSDAAKTRKIWNTHPQPDPALLAQQLGDLACDAEQAPYVARGILRQISHSDLRGLGPYRATLAARMANDQVCLGASGLSDDERTLLAKMAAGQHPDAERQQPPPLPLGNRLGKR